MQKKIGKILIAFLFSVLLFPNMNVYAQDTMTVTSQDELKTALENKDVSTIILGNDIETTEKINVLRSVTIDGNGHTMKYVGTFGNDHSNDKTTWSGIYLLQFYKTEGILKNIKLTGGNAGLLINGATVQIEGMLDVSDNGFGGIELGQGAAVQSFAHIILTDTSNIINTTESKTTPTLWVPQDSTSAIIERNGIKENLTPGVELTLKEINDLLNTSENPNTSDSFMLYLLVGILGTISLGYGYHKANQN